MREPKCFKTPENPALVDLMLANFFSSFPHSRSIETGLSNFYKKTMAVMNTTFQKLVHMN